MDSRISWKKAYGGSLVIHALVFGLFMCFLAGSVAHHEEEKMYVIDLDASELTGAGSGHAGGGGGGAANLFVVNCYLKRGKVNFLIIMNFAIILKPMTFTVPKPACVSIFLNDWKISKIKSG